MSIRSKLVLWYTGVLLFSGATLTTTLYLLVAHKMHSEAETETADEYAEWHATALKWVDDLPELERQVRAELATESVFPMAYRLHDAATGRDLLYVGHRVCEHYRAQLAEALPLDHVTQAPYQRQLWVGRRPRPFRIHTGPLDPARHPHLVVQVAVYTRRVHKRVLSVRKYLFLALGGTVLLAAAGGWFLASRSLKPIDELAAELSHVQSSTLADRLEVGSAGGELDRLREAINRMLARIEAAFATLQSFTADAAHELRTPISALQCRIEVALQRARSTDDYAGALGDALEQTAQLTTIVENLLLLARMDATDGLGDHHDVHIAELLEDLAEPFALLAEQKGVALGTECHGNCVLEGNPMLLRRLFGNLLDNAIRYTPAGGRVTLTGKPEASGCQITVADTGVGIAPEALGHVFDRFYRADESRSRDAGGTGLGLSIAKHVAELHGGHIDIESTMGKGTTLGVWLPARPQAAQPDAAETSSPA